MPVSDPAVPSPQISQLEITSVDLHHLGSAGKQARSADYPTSTLAAKLNSPAHVPQSPKLGHRVHVHVVAK